MLFVKNRFVLVFATSLWLGGISFAASLATNEVQHDRATLTHSIHTTASIEDAGSFVLEHEGNGPEGGVLVPMQRLPAKGLLMVIVLMFASGALALLLEKRQQPQPEAADE